MLVHYSCGIGIKRLIAGILSTKDLMRSHKAANNEYFPDLVR